MAVEIDRIISVVALFIVIPRHYCCQITLTRSIATLLILPYVRSVAVRRMKANLVNSRLSWSKYDLTPRWTSKGLISCSFLP